MNPLNSIVGTIVAGLVLSLLIVLATADMHLVVAPLSSLIIWAHVFAGIVWIGLLYYFNFIQVPAVGEALQDEGGPGPAGISKYVAPRALLWFRWGAAFTWITGALFLMFSGKLHAAFTLGMLSDAGDVYAMTIGIGAWLGTIMLFNVWVLIWPNQKKILGMVEASAEQIAKAKKVALMASRANTMMSFPLIMSMVGAHHGMFM